MKIRYGPDGVHLFNRENGLNILLDEIKPSKLKWSKAPRNISIALTNACDLECPFCYAPKYSARLNSTELVAWLKELDKHGCLGVGFGGGEPTLYKDLPELCYQIREETELAISMTTHSHRLNDRLLQELNNNLDFIRISMDGIGSTYERIRKRPFDNLLELFERLRSDFQFGINYVVNAETVKDLDEAIEVAERFSANEFLLLPEISFGRGSGIDGNSYKKLKDWINGYSNSIPLVISEGTMEGITVCNPFSNEEDIEGYAHIDASGRLKTNSYSTEGIKIENKDIMSALDSLTMKMKEEIL